MYKNLNELLLEIYKSSPRVVNMSLDDFAAEVAKRTGNAAPSKSTIKYALNELGIVSAPGKKRTFIFKHNGGKK